MLDMAALLRTLVAHQRLARSPGDPRCPTQRREIRHGRRRLREGGLPMSALGWLILLLLVAIVVALVIVVLRRRRRGGGVFATRAKP